MNLEELQLELQHRIEKLDEERQENSRKNKEERERMLLDIEIERRVRMEDYQNKVAALEAKRKVEEAKEAQRIKETAERVAAEQKQNVLDETLRLQKEKLEWLTTAISNAEFTEEQSRKAMESMRMLPPIEFPTGDEVSSEYPQTGADGGTSAEGTDGSTPETQSMSMHLRQILRQAQRN